MFYVFQRVILFATLAGLAVTLGVLVVRSKTLRAVQVKVLALWSTLTPSGRTITISFLTVCILYGGSKTNSPPRMMMRPAASVQLTYAEKKARNWNIRGAWRDSFWLKFARGWRFPSGTNHLYGVEVISFGQLWPTPFNTNAVASLGSRVEIVPGLSSFGYELTPSNSYRFAWGNAAINRDTNDLVTASLELFRNGDIAVTTNGVAKYIPRELPSDWGDPSADDFYGNDNTLPDEADEGAYYWIDLVVSNAAAKVTFNGDKPSNYSDPEFVANNDSTNRVTLLIGKPYTVTCDEAIGVTATSSDDVLVTRVSENQIDIVWPVEFDMMQNAAASYALSRSTTQVPVAGGFSITSFPFLNGYYVWDTNVCCNLVSNKIDGVWNYSCNANCSCMGCSFAGAFHYEGYWLQVTGVSCGCSYREEPSATAGISFAGAAVVFENCYTNAPNDIVPRRSTTNSLEISVYGGPYGGEVRIEFDDNGKLEYLTSDEIPRSFSVAPGETVTHLLQFIAKEESATENDITASLVFTEYVSGDVLESEDEMTAVRVEVEALEDWPENKNRHIFGPRELAEIKQFPHLPAIKFGKILRYGGIIIPAEEGLWSIENGRRGDCYSVDGICSADGCTFVMDFSVLEPTEIRAENEHHMSEAEVNSFNAQSSDFQIPEMTVGFAGVIMKIDTYLEPDSVNYKKLKLFEGYAPTSNRQGWYQDYDVFPEDVLCHGSPDIPILNYMQEASRVGNLNKIGDNDIAGGWIGVGETYFSGSFDLNIPVYWFVADDEFSDPILFTTCLQRTYVYTNGTMRVEKFGKYVERALTEGLD